MKKLLAASLLLVNSMSSFGEDIELYVSESVKQSGKKAKVLIIFDNSGSMGTLHNVKSPYLPDDAETPPHYPPEDSSHAYNDDAIYFNKGSADGSSTIPDSPSDARRFIGDINSCESSKAALAKYGFYTGHIREYTMKGNTGTWNELPENNGLNIEILDCEEDVAEVDDDGDFIAGTGNVANASPLPSGYPADNLGTKKTPIYHTNDATELNVVWSGPLVTLYTANYLRWYHSTTVDTVPETLLESAKRSIANVIDTTDGIEFGLEIFNFDDGDLATDPNGGRVVFGIKEMTSANQASLIDIIENQITAQTWTPLCESVYEASQYFAGNAVIFGDDDESRAPSYTANQPPADSSIINSDNQYIAPFNECSDQAYIILITDGAPTFDAAANTKVQLLKTQVPKTDESGAIVLDDSGNPIMIEKSFDVSDPLFNAAPYSDDNVTNSYLPALAGWLNTYDANLNLSGEQHVSTHTIGFSEGAANAAGLLEQTALRGGGEYFVAIDELQLTEALQATLRNLTPSNDSLTSASVAANNFDRTETLNSVYYAMFDPQNGPRWQGNLKKYKVIDNVQVGINGVPALDEETGHFSTLVKSYWSDDIDGNLVAKGGVADWYIGKNPTDERTMYTDTSGVGSLLADFSRSNFVTAFGDEAALATELGVAGLVDSDGNSIESTAIDEMLNWAIGMDVDDENRDTSTTEMRADVFGDPLHSKPLVVNYGDSIRLVIGTNTGVLHMFEDKGEDVVENWAFMPQEFLRNIKPLRDNFASDDKVYGIDGQITSHIIDLDGNGIINGNDKVWIFFGLRRGGTSYYAIDISDPVKPVLMWHIDSTTAGFSELGQTWSKPKVGYSKLNITGTGDNAVAAPVLFFGGGYDTNKDASGPGTADNKGRAIYMVDAASGGLKWSLAASDSMTAFSGTDSIASSIATLDSTGDGLTDRLYTGDTGGNVWRVDMPSANPQDSDNPWTVFKLASLGGEVDNATDNRFFSEASIVRTFINETIETVVIDEDGKTTTVISHQEKPYDAVLLGSGDRSNPLGVDTKDTFFMLKDANIRTQSFYSSAEPIAPSAIVKTDLADYTNNPFAQTMTTQQREALEVEVSQKSGWYIDLTLDGEKSTAEAIVINGVVYFTSYSPPPSVEELVNCKPPSGSGWLYAVDLALGTQIYNWQSEDPDNRDDRIALISEQFLGAPTLIVLPDDDSETNGDAVGNIIVGRKIIPVGFSLETMRTYLYIKEEL